MCGKEVSSKLYNKLFSPSIPVGLEADTLQVDLFDLLKEGRGYVVGMFSYCSSVRCNLRVSTGPFHLHHSWVFTPNCPDSCWGTQVFNRMFNSHSLWPYSLFHKETVLPLRLLHLQPVSQSLWMALTLTVQVMHVSATATELIDWRLLIMLFERLSDSVTYGFLSVMFRVRVGGRLDNQGDW